MFKFERGEMKKGGSGVFFCELGTVVKLYDKPIEEGYMCKNREANHNNSKYPIERTSPYGENSGYISSRLYPESGYFPLPILPAFWY